MAFVTSFNGVIFIEGDHPRAWKKFSAKTTVGGFGSQLRNLNDLKQQMAYTANLLLYTTIMREITRQGNN